MKKYKAVILTIVVAVLIVGGIFSLTSYAVKERDKMIEESREGCDFFVITSHKQPIDCYASRFYKRMEDLNKVGIYCFTSVDDYVFLKCYWEDKTAQ